MRVKLVGMRRSLDLREQALRSLSQGLSRKEVCQVFGIHRTTLRRWQIRQASDTLAPRTSPGAKRKLSPDDEERLVTQLEAYPDDTVDQHLLRWREELQAPVSRATLGRAILRLNWTRKKRV
jgi:transposase